MGAGTAQVPSWGALPGVAIWFPSLALLWADLKENFQEKGHSAAKRRWPLGQGGGSSLLFLSVTGHCPAPRRQLPQGKFALSLVEGSSRSSSFGVRW